MKFATCNQQLAISDSDLFIVNCLLPIQKRAICKSKGMQTGFPYKKDKIKNNFFCNEVKSKWSILVGFFHSKTETWLFHC